MSRTRCAATRISTTPPWSATGRRTSCPCAVIVSQRPLTLGEVRGYLDGIGMTAWYQPQRLEVVDQLPRNSTGMVDKRVLRRWLA
jgi:non-ribosomal peptide synthetase component E (peptide arylation enzyme)